MTNGQKVKSYFVIDQGDVSHAGQISLLSEQLGYRTTRAEVEQRITAIAASPNDAMYVALEDHLCVGWIHVFYTLRLESAPFCEIGGLVVHQDWRSKGVGGLLVKEAKQWCNQKGIRSLRVRSNVIRSEAHSFYLRQGFKEIKKQSVFELDV